MALFCAVFQGLGGPVALCATGLCPTMPMPTTPREPLGETGACGACDSCCDAPDPAPSCCEGPASCDDCLRCCDPDQDRGLPQRANAQQFRVHDHLASLSLAAASPASLPAPRPELFRLPRAFASVPEQQALLCVWLN